MSGPKAVVDLHALDEDTRIGLIGRAADGGKVVAFIVDDGPKANRYITKLLARFPGVEVVGRHEDVPIAGAVTVKVGPKPTGRPS